MITNFDIIKPWLLVLVVGVGWMGFSWMFATFYVARLFPEEEEEK